MSVAARNKKYLEGFLTGVEEAIDLYAKRVAGEVFIQAIQFTVVDTGRAKYNWQIDTHGQSDFDMNPSHPPVGDSSRANAEARAANSAAVMVEKMVVLAEFYASPEPLQSVFVYNPIDEGVYQGNALFLVGNMEAWAQAAIPTAEQYVKAQFPGMFS